MSPDTIAVGVFTIAGTLLGVIVGALTERLVRVTGRLRFECSSSSLRPDVGSAHGGPLSMDWTEVNKEMSVQGAQYIFAIDLFNGKEVPTGLRGVRVRLIRDDGECFESRPLVPLQRNAMQAVEVINILPRQFAHLELHGNLPVEAAEAIRDKKWQKVEFVGESPKRPFFGIGSKTYRETIIKP